MSPCGVSRKTQIIVRQMIWDLNESNVDQTNHSMGQTRPLTWSPWSPLNTLVMVPCTEKHNT